MRESHMEGLASRHGPRSCARHSSPPPRGGGVKVRSEVSLTCGESARWVLSSESIRPGLPAYLLGRVGHASRTGRARGSR